ncbi:MAG: hypothetical protein BWY85_00803 [Firmicutes bacterium ADurb.Bin506]|jgi:hypothetical protein|nr:MAG: hypothetical protein BWY85_00803 [Firmicutes bacterium ADurb.Bin506]
MKIRREHLLIALVLVVGIGLVYYGMTRRGPAATPGTRLRITSEPRGSEKTISVQPLVAGLDDIIEVEGPLGITVVEVDGTRAHVVSSPCPDKICIKMGWLERPGEYAACLPNRVLAEVLSPEEQ